MLGILIAIAGLVAVGAWLVAVSSAFSAIRLVPVGQRLSAWFTLGWWQFDKLRALAGAGVEPHIKRYTQAFLTFFLAILVAIIVGALVTAAAQDDATEADRASADPLPSTSNSSVLES